jgi:hypothetical protein
VACEVSSPTRRVRFDPNQKRVRTDPRVKRTPLFPWSSFGVGRRVARSGSCVTMVIWWKHPNPWNLSSQNPFINAVECTWSVFFSGTRTAWRKGSRYDERHVPPTTSNRTARPADFVGRDWNVSRLPLLPLEQALHPMVRTRHFGHSSDEACTYNDGYLGATNARIRERSGYMV